VTLNQLKAAVRAVKSEDDLQKIRTDFQLQVEDRRGKADQVLLALHGEVEGEMVAIIHRWYDRSKPYSIQPDGNKVELIVKGATIAAGQFDDPS